MMSAKKSDISRESQKNQRIQVFARTRPISPPDGNFHCVVEVCSEKKEIRIRHKTVNKGFAFDGVFGPETKQIQVYKAVVEPLIQEVLMGYNCTVFAYGQTSTGKTYTMEGERSNTECDWDKDPTAGIIPRSLHQLFDELYKEENVEFSVHVSFLELYSEELYDLLSPNDVQHASKLKLYEDVNRKGSVVIQGLEEIKVNSKDEVYEILERGTQRRQTAATALNANSSRSHTIFSVTVHIKENTIDGEELLKTGKLNLVDLAGSECIGRSGVTQKGACEAGNINRSLLTLGRVITSLVEKHPHVPYRESKLTRLLQDSLGGHTKTSIIATVSLSLSNLDETISTLDYAQRAKSITIKPEVNQKMTKRALIKEYTEEIERLRKDLVASRDKSGVYLHPENHAALLNDITAKSKAIEDLNTEKDKLNEDLETENKKVISLEEELVRTKSQLSNMTSQCSNYKLKCRELIKKYRETSKTLKMTKQSLHQTALQRDENQYIISIQNKTEEQLAKQAREVLQIANESTNDVSTLHSKICRKNNVDKMNEQQSEEFRKYFKEHLSTMNGNFVQNSNQLMSDLETVSTHICNILELCNKYYLDFVNVNNKSSALGNVYLKFNQGIQSNSELFSNTHENNVNFCDFNVENINELKNLNAKLLEELTSLQTKDMSMRNYLVSKMSSLEKLLVDIYDDTNTKIKELELQIKSSTEIHQTQIQDLNKQFDEFCSGLENDRKCRYTQYKLEETNYEKFKQVMTETVEEIKSLQKLQDEKLQILTDIKESYDQNKRKETLETEEFNNVSHKRMKTEKEKLKDVISCYEKDEDMRWKKFVAFSESASSERKTNQEQVSTQCQSIIQEYENKEMEFETSYQTSKGFVIKQGDYLTTVDKRIAVEREVLKQSQNKYQDHITEFKANIENRLSGMETEMNSYKENVFPRLQGQLSVLEKTSCLVTNTTKTMKDEITKCDEEVHNFFLNTLKKDSPTGLTPKKKDYIYPTTFVATSPPERLLQRYRTQLSINEASAIKLSLDSSSDNSFGSCKFDGQTKESKEDIPSSFDYPSSDECFESCTPHSSLSDLNSESNKSKENMRIPLRKPSRLPKRKSFKKKNSFPKLRPISAKKPLKASNNIPRLES